MTKIFIQIGFDALGKDKAEALKEAVEIEQMINARYDNRACIFNADNRIDSKESLMKEIRQIRNEVIESEVLNGL